MIRTVLGIILFNKNQRLFPDGAPGNCLNDATKRSIVLGHELKGVENLLIRAISMIAWQPDVMKLRDVAELQLRLEIFFPFAHAIQIRSLQVPRSKAERVVI